MIYSETLRQKKAFFIILIRFACPFSDSFIINWEYVYYSGLVLL